MGVKRRFQRGMRGNTVPDTVGKVDSLHRRKGKWFWKTVWSLSAIGQSENSGHCKNSACTVCTAGVLAVWPEILTVCWACWGSSGPARPTDRLRYAVEGNLVGWPVLADKRIFQVREKRAAQWMWMLNCTFILKNPVPLCFVFRFYIALFSAHMWFHMSE